MIEFNPFIFPYLSLKNFIVSNIIGLIFIGGVILGNYMTKWKK